MHLYAIGVGREVAMRHRWAGGRSRSMNFCDHRRRPSNQDAYRGRRLAELLN